METEKEKIESICKEMSEFLKNPNWSQESIANMFLNADMRTPGDQSKLEDPNYCETDLETNYENFRTRVAVIGELFMELIITWIETYGKE